MTDYRRLNAMPINREAAALLKKTSWTMDQRNQLAVVQLLLWLLDENKQISLAVWVKVPWEDRDRDGEELALWLAKQERANPMRIMRLLTITDSGDPYQIDLSGTPEEAAETLLEELISAMQAEQPITTSTEN
ncbi:MAG TPA: hypothetical protein PKH05_16365 [Nitrospira sp.]|nr:hypothetical protein [Nitrospira sp.]